MDNRNHDFVSQSYPTRTKRSSFQAKKLLIPAVITFASLGSLALIAVAIIWGRQFLPEGTSLGELSSTLSGGMLGDSLESVATDLQTLRTQVEEIGRSIPSGDQSEASAKRLLAELPKFHALFRRACKLPIKSVSLEDFVEERRKMREQIEQRKNEMQNSPSPAVPSPRIFWSINGTAKKDDLVSHAISEVTSAMSSVSMIMSQVLIDYPDPLTYAGSVVEWSEEDRRVLAIIRLQGNTERDALRTMAMIDPKSPSSNDLNKLHALIDQAIETSKELRKLPNKAKGGMLAFVPKGNPYELHQKSAMLGLMTVKRLMQDEATLTAEVTFLFEEVTTFHEMSEGIIFGSSGRSSSVVLSTAATSSERFKAFVAAEEERKADALQAEIDRKNKEQQRLADAQLREQVAAEERRKKEEERQRALDERLAAASSGNAGGRLGARGPEGLAGGIGPRPGPIGVPTGPGGSPRDSLGNDRQLGQPPNFPGFGTGPLGPRQGGFQPPSMPQGDPAKMVTITCDKVKNNDSSVYSRDLPKWLLQYSPTISISNGSLKITVQNYDKPLADLAPCFPMLLFEKIDIEKRTITAKEK